jgi:hypothetical protein
METLSTIFLWKCHPIYNFPIDNTSYCPRGGDRIGAILQPRERPLSVPARPMDKEKRLPREGRQALTARLAYQILAGKINSKH